MSSPPLSVNHNENGTRTNSHTFNSNTDIERTFVQFESVPAFAYALDVKVDVPTHGAVTVDIGFGGAYYALCPASVFGLDVLKSPTHALVSAADAVTQAVRRSVIIEHPTADKDLGFLYGTILTDGADRYVSGQQTPTANICVFAKREVDRSPTGSGVTARMAVQYARGLVARDQMRRFQSITGDIFTGRIVSAGSYPVPRDWKGNAYNKTPIDTPTTSTALVPTVCVQVGGRAFYTGQHVFVVEPHDPLRNGFLLA